jgi:hypothetical protein
MSPLTISPGGASSRDNDAWLPLSAVLIAAVCAVSSRGCEVDALDGAANGEGETDEEADATGGSGAGIFDRVTEFDVVLWEKIVINENRGIR